MIIEFKGNKEKIKAFLKEFELRLKKDKITYSEIKETPKVKKIKNQKSK